MLLSFKYTVLSLASFPKQSLSQLNGSLSNKVVKQSITTSKKNITAGASVSFSVSCVKTGYTPIAIASWHIVADKNGSNITPVILEVSGTTINITAKNTSTSLDATNAYYIVDVLYSKN